MIIVLQYVPKYYQNPLPRHLIYSVSQSIYTDIPLFEILTDNIGDSN